MINYPIRIGRTRNCFFTKTQKNKLEAGIEILLRVINHKHFSDQILQFDWINDENRRFFRFYHANNLSNKQVLHRLHHPKEYFEDLGQNDQLVILPFNSRKEIANYQSVSNPIIWLSLNCINNNWYTPVHIASAVGHELSVLLGLDSSSEKMPRAKYTNYKVPNFVGSLVMQTANLWQNSVTDIRDAFDQIDPDQYNYFPASTVVGSSINTSIQSHQNNFDSLISSLLIEQEMLFALQDDLTPTETARLICLEEVLLNLNKLKNKLADSSLDGSELDLQFADNKLGPRRDS